MSSSFGRSVHFYYVTTLIILAAALGLGTKFYWTKGAANVENVSSVFEAILQIDDLKKRKDVKTIKTLVEQDRVRDAVARFDTLSADIEKLNQVHEVDSYDTLEKTLGDSRKALNTLISYPELSSIFLVLGSKVATFENFVVQNNWRTLTRMSKRIKTRISPSRVKSPGFFKYRTMKSLVSTISNEVKTMKSVTENSVLSRTDKSIIINKLNTLNTEIRMLNKYLKSLKYFYTNYTILKGSYNKWFSEVEPEISYKKISFEKNSQTVLFSMIGLVAFIVLAIALGSVVYTFNNKRNKRKVEEIVIDSIKNGMVPVHSKMAGSYSQDFTDEFEKYREYVHKRMSFGTIFQDAMPFSSLLLDSNLNLVWANSLFYEHWELDKKMEDSVTWDYLQRFTNLGEDDPVLGALNQDLAGIYNIQVKTNQQTDAQPYEMYVSPVEYAGQKRIMIFFYPLRSIEDALANQSRSLVSPVSRTLDALSTGMFTSEFKEKVKKDFDIAGTSDIYEKFLKYNEFNESQKNGLLGEIENLENTLYDQYKLVDDIGGLNTEHHEIQKESMIRFKDAKDSVISIVELRNEIETLFKSTVETSQSLFKDEVELLSHTVGLAEVMDENTKAFSNVIKVKDEFKVLKNNVEQYKTKTMQMLDQLLVFKKNDENSVKFEQGLTRMKLEMQSFEKTLATFGQIATALDVGLSKMQLIMSRSEVPNLNELRRNFDTAREKLEHDLFSANKIMRTGQVKDEEMIKALKGLYTSFQTTREKLKEIDGLMLEHAHQKETHFLEHREEVEIRPESRA